VSFENEQFLGYDIKTLLEICFPVKCPKCNTRFFEVFLSPDDEHLIFVCYQCRYIPTLKEVIRLVKEARK